MIIYKKDSSLIIPVGLGLNVSQASAHPLQNKQVDPSTSELNVKADSSYYGLNQVTVNGVTSSIDSNIIESNIRKDITILGVTGNLESETVNNQDKTVDSSTTEQNITADNGYSGLGTVTVNPYTLDSKTVDPSTVSQTVNSSADGLSSVTVNAVTSSIDSNITAGNIKNGVTILGVTGTFTSDNYIYEVKTGARTSLTTDFAGLTNYKYELEALFRNSALESFTATISTWGNTPDNKEGLMYNMCRECNNLESVSFPNWTGSTNADHQFTQAFEDCPKLASVNFPEMTVAYGFNSAFEGSGDYSADASANFNKLEIINELGMYRCFLNSGFTFINMPLLQTVNYGGLYLAFDNSSVGSMTFPSLTTCPNNNYNESRAFEDAFYNNPNITSVSFPELTTIGNSCFRRTFYNATGLTTLNLPKLSVFIDNTGHNPNPFGQDEATLYGCTALVNLTIHPNCLTGDILRYAPNITNLTITADATDNIYLNWQSSLTEASVLSVLTHLDLNTSGKSVTFYTGGLTVTDDAQGSLQTAYDAATTAGWTINNLTITPYSPGVNYVQYIESIEDNWCQLDIPETFSYGTKIELDTYVPTNNLFGIGYGISGGFTSRMIYNLNGSNSIFDYPDDMGGDNRLWLDNSDLLGTRHVITYDFNSSGQARISSDNVVLGNVIQIDTTQYSGYSFTLFSTESAHTHGGLKYYEVKWYEESGGQMVMIHDYKPCLDGNNVACLYDEVTQTYLRPSSGSCNAGPAVNS